MLPQLMTRYVVGQVIPINLLPDDILLEIFDFCVDQDAFRRFIFSQRERKAWQTLVHVCRRWRSIVFRSPLRLNLVLVYTEKTPARDTLDVWPPLPLVILSHGHYRTDIDFSTERVDNISAVLEHSDRVCQISLINVPNSHLEKLLAAVQEPFPELTHLLLSSYSEPVIPDSFLGGSAPRLQDIWFRGIPFPGLPKLLLSATHLVHLYLQNIPHSGYISPEAMATTLSTLTCLRILDLGFQSPQSFPNQESRRPPPLIRSSLPVLTNFTFRGVSDYLELLVARVDAPQLNRSHITYFNQIVFDTPQFTQFIGRTPKLKAPERAQVSFGDAAAMVNLSSLTSIHRHVITMKIPCRDLDWQVSSLEQVFTSSLPPLSALEDLYIHKHPESKRVWQDNIENELWLELLQPFPAVKNLYLCVVFAPRIVPALQELVGGRTTEVLPNLQNIFLEELQLTGPVRVAIQPFVAARQVINHPVAVSRWNNPEQDKNSVLR
jgi:F-box-like